MTEPGAVPASVLIAVARGGARDAGGTDVALLGDFLPQVVAAVSAGIRLRRGEIQQFKEAGKLAAVRGVALRALLDLYLSAAWRLWEHLPEVIAADQDPAGVVRAGRAMLRATDDAVAALTQGYQLARRDVMQAEISARREFVDDLLAGSSDVAGLIERAAGFGLTLAGPHAVAVLRAATPFTDQSPATRMLERSVRGSMADSDALVATKDGRIVVVFAAPDKSAVTEIVDSITVMLPSQQGGSGPVQLTRLADVGAWQLGVGRRASGAAGVKSSFDDAREALDLGARLGRDLTVLDATELLVYRVLLRDEVAIRDLVNAVLTPLEDARGGAAPLIDTLLSYFGTGGNAARTAREMHLSVRAVTYRLDRVKDLTGHDPDDPMQRFTLHTAVLGALLLKWPTVPLV